MYNGVGKKIQEGSFLKVLDNCMTNGFDIAIVASIVWHFLLFIAIAVKMEVQSGKYDDYDIDNTFKLERLKMKWIS